MINNRKIIMLDDNIAYVTGFYELARIETARWENLQPALPWFWSSAANGWLIAHHHSSRHSSLTHFTFAERMTHVWGCGVGCQGSFARRRNARAQQPAVPVIGFLQGASLPAGLRLTGPHSVRDLKKSAGFMEGAERSGGGRKPPVQREIARQNLGPQKTLMRVPQL